MNFYGFFIALGVLVGTLVAENFRTKQPATSNQHPAVSAFDILLWVIIPGVIGARIYHVLDYWQYYNGDLLKIFYVWEGGLGIYGGIIGGVVGLYLFTKIKSASWRKKSKISYTNYFLLYLDLASIALPIGQAIGRWGNFFNQELYGLPTNLPWGIYIRPENRLPGYESFSRYHPLFLYESLGCLIIFFIILKKIKLNINNKNAKLPQTRINSVRGWQIKKQKNYKNGDLFFLYLFLYSFLRFWLEFLRIESWQVRLPLTINSIRVNQLAATLAILVSGWFLFKEVKIKTHTFKKRKISIE
ncbi:prolipoprotein diacylglyceryl transferase [Candidatus Beckwithbacteria bacterium RBG_13_35_6]|uniref:Phosphatidylglycerol--prolipoprotein diacylglyceryl transferase n=1 Tax=Candidatus Beckwithbacteria bacterium RBG_13_35_6 TaxID=1797456 RepID=A0A1F5DDR0_9BACT|nr:MAG: prolipoprotein diacylglyceryl transferase [Candidatus Beckwithbacteria bacterium RBG_13_35_6]